MVYNFDEVQSRKNNESIKWDALKERYGKEDLIPLWVADMEFQAPLEVREALLERLNQGIFGYTALGDDFYQAFINWVYKRHQWIVEKKELLFSPGVVPSIVMSILTFTKEKDTIIIQPPVYGPFEASIKDHNRQVIKNPLKEINGNYEMDLDHLESLFQAGHKVMILCNPHNPVGRVWDDETLSKLSRLVVQYDAMVISDEIHSDLVFYGHQHRLLVNYEGMAERTITFMAPTKTFNLAGLQTSIIICKNEKWLAKLKDTFYKMDLKINNYFGQTAFKASYDKGELWLEELIKYLEGNMSFALEFFKKHLYELKINKPEGTYLMWVDFRNLHMSQDQINHFLVNKAGLAFSDGLFFGEEGRGFMRMNIACPRTMLEKALIQLEKAMRTLRL
ncbi:MAG: pyridoxal phosphate-dependent aminotransferase [Clostridia bacterium]|nr:pyridoxal phosphate-dependent aminotransferase [Clostridia bacterium]